MLKPTASVEYIWRDETGSTAMTSLSVPVGLTVSEIDVTADAVASILASVTGCVLVRQSIKWRAQTVPRTEPADSTPITRSCAFYFSVDPPSPDGIVIVPSIKESVISDEEPFAGVAIDRSNSDIVSLVDAILSLGATNVFGDVFTSLVAAYRVSRV